MPRAREARLGRIATQSTAADTAALWHQTTLRARVKVGAALREALAELAIDPAKVPMLSIADTAAQELTLMADHTMPYDILDAAAPGDEDGGVSADEFGSRIMKLAQRYREKPDIDFAQASLGEAFAWCVAHLQWRAD
jgi:hypothetical protein